MVEKTLGYLKKFTKVDSVNAVDKLSSVVWFGGCSYRCQGCHNPDTWKLRTGEKITQSIADEMINSIPSGFDLALLGGDPLEIQNLEATLYLVNKFKRLRPSDKILLWTGRDLDTAEQLMGASFKKIDYIKCGKFDILKFKKGLKYYGSTNQNFYLMENGLIKKQWSDELEDFIMEEK